MYKHCNIWPLSLPVKMPPAKNRDKVYCSQANLSHLRLITLRRYVNDL